MLKIVKTALLLASVGLAVPASAIEFGRAHLASAPGKPLRITIPVRDLSAQDLQSLSVRVASEQQWRQAGLTPPVPLSDLSVRVIDGPRPNTRLLELRANDVPSSSVIDVLLDISSASTKRLFQSSVISHAAPTVRLSGQTQKVLRGDTLIGVAQQFPVQGATLYQMLWALYSTNRHAFVADNMNLLKAGASLSIPSDAQVLAVNPAFARQQYLAHVQAFNASRGRRGSSSVTSEPQHAALELQSSNRGQVEAVKAESEPSVVDRVQLSSAQTGQADLAADQQTSQMHAQREAQERVQSLERNVEALKGALAAADAAQAQTVTNTQGQSSATGAQNASENGTVNPVAGSALGGQSQTESQFQAQSSSQSQQSGNTPGAAGGLSNPESGQASTDSKGMTQGVGESARQGAANQNGTKSDINGSAAAQTQSSDSAVEQVKQWVSDNVLAAGALFLALIALVFAWVMRSSAQRVASTRDNPQAKAFEEKLKEIDLNLGDAPAAGAAAPVAATSVRHGKGKGGKKGGRKS